MDTSDYLRFYIFRAVGWLKYLFQLVTHVTINIYFVIYISPTCFVHAGRLQVGPITKQYICNMYHKMAVPENRLYELTHVAETLRNNNQKKLFIIKGVVSWSTYFTL